MLCKSVKKIFAFWSIKKTVGTIWAPRGFYRAKKKRYTSKFGLAPNAVKRHTSPFLVAINYFFSSFGVVEAVGSSPFTCTKDLASQTAQIRSLRGFSISCFSGMVLIWSRFCKKVQTAAFSSSVLSSRTSAIAFLILFLASWK